MTSPPFLFLTYLTFFSLSLLSPATPLSTVSITTISNNRTLVCALTKSSPSILNCTTFPKAGFNFSIGPHNYSYSSIVGGNQFLCGLVSFPSVSISFVGCWRFGGDDTRLYYSYKRIYKGPILEELYSGNDHVCGVVSGTNRLNCWQWKGFNSRSSFNSASIAVGGDFICGLNEFGNINCLGNYNNVVGKRSLSGNYSVISAGYRRFCAISFNGRLKCWGAVQGGRIPGRGEEFTSIALGENRSCALRVNGTVVCWGSGSSNNFGMPSILEETFFTGIVSQGKVFCGVVSANYSLVCWGNEFLDSNPLVFNDVVPGVCRNYSRCPFGPLPDSGRFCGQGQYVCQSGVLQSTMMGGRLPSSPPPTSPRETGGGGGGGWSATMVVFLVVGCVGLISLVGTAAFVFVSRGSRDGSSRVHDSGHLDNETDDQQGDGPGRSIGSRSQRGPPILEKRLSHTISMGLNGGHLEEFSLQVLSGVTNSFSQDHKIGNGSFGSVYHAILEDGREVAIKRAEFSKSAPYGRDTNRHHQDKDTAFLAELAFLSRLNHKNLVKLLGFCEDDSERMLVYDYVSNGNLHDHLHKLKERSALKSWTSRLKVALDAARGIEYIHSYADPPVIHRDIKSSNILLDANWMAKVSDFGLSLMVPEEESQLSLMAAGTVGYMDPEYYRLHQLTTKSDVYSFGVVLLELLTGYTAIHLNENAMPRNVVEFVVPYIFRDDIHRILDPNLPPATPVEIEAVTDVGHLAAECVTLPGRERPSMTDIVNCLERAWKVCLAPPALCWSSTESSST